MLNTKISAQLDALGCIIRRHECILKSCMEGQDLALELTSIAAHMDSVDNAIRNLETVWRRHEEFLNSTEEGKKLSREMCELDSVLTDIQLGCD